MKRVYIIHCWGGHPNDAWYPWLKQKLVENGFSVEILSMPNTDEPVITSWVSHLADVIAKPDQATFFVGHSIGCQTILRFVEQQGIQIGGAVFVAGWFSLTNLETDEERRISKPWLELPINLEKLQSLIPKSIAIFSDDDPVVPMKENADVFESRLGSKIIQERGMGHFSNEDQIMELESALTGLLEITA